MSDRDAGGAVSDDGAAALASADRVRVSRRIQEAP